MDSVNIIFDDGGIYRAKLHLISTANCYDSLVREFNILDKIQVVGSKTHTFDDGPESWHTDSISVDGFYDGIDYDIDEIDNIEKVTKHDVIAFLTYLSKFIL